MENTTASAIHAIHAARNAAQESRDYMGWSMIGAECDRALWLGFRWAGAKQVEGRVARLFDSGHREEARILEELRAIGCKVEAIDPKTRGQIGVSSHGGHFRGHLDAIVTGLPEAPTVRHLVDVKTANTKNFDKVVRDGIEKTFPKYWAQGHGYAAHMGLSHCAFIFVCKDDDRIHVERFAADPAVAQRYEDRAARLIFSDRMPPPISVDPSWFSCKWCEHHDLCHGSRLVKQVNCRTCCHSTPGRSGGWTCARYDGAEIPLDAQRTGCEAHALHPDLVPWQMAEPVDEWTPVYIVGGRKVANGAPDANIYSSRELIANAGLCGDEMVAELRQEFPSARVVG